MTEPLDAADADPEALDAVLAAYRRPTAAMRVPVTALQLLCATRVARGPVLAFVSDAEPHLALPLGVAAPVGRFDFLQVSAIEPDFFIRIRPVPVDPEAGEPLAPPGDHPPPRACLAGTLSHGQCREPTMDYFAVPPGVAAFLSACPRKPRVELVPAQALRVPRFVEAVYPWQAGALLHGLAVDPVFVDQPDLVWPPDNQEQPAPAPACCWYGAALRHAAGVVGADNIRLLRASETGILEDMERSVACLCALSTAAHPVEGGGCPSPEPA